MNASTTPRPIVPRESWLEARQALLADEKALTRAYDELCRRRRELPWVKVEKVYTFDTPEGPRTLADLFDGRGQLIVYHFMFGPGWKEGCVGCSLRHDHLGLAPLHLAQHDLSYVAVSRAPLAEIEAFKRRMGWTFAWVSSFDTDFNFDYHVSVSEADKARGEVYSNFRWNPYDGGDEMSGTSVFVRGEDGEVFHTYSCYGRGDEAAIGSYVLLDLTPRGRSENVRGNLSDWARHHDRYGADGTVLPTGRYQAAADGVPAAESGSCHGRAAQASATRASGS
jgi:predicted dithiol-disulfide oxidoreductase (DUF899 family)